MRHSQPEAVAGLVEYQSDAVVSKTIVDTAAGSVTVFAFDRGQGLSEHTSPYNALVCVVDGEAEITIDSVPVTVRSGELIVMPANRPHSLKALNKFKMMLIMIRS
ncbi:MAG TPA: cupin domain-containing protein [bacterium]|nr:cupin domain-containing protein [bacterium]HPQ65912.1 cupin domain-containing protein [bacterium]